jgi:hypothetical protein
MPLFPGAVILGDFIQMQRHAMPSQGSPQEGSAHCGAASVARALGRDMAGGLRIDRGVALVAQTQFASERRSETKLLLNMREDQMPSILNETLEWLDRAEQAREVAGQLTDPGARRAVLELAESFDRLARAAATPAVLRRRELATKDQ